MTNEYLLETARSQLADWRGWSVRRELADRYGAYGLLCRHADRGSVIVLAKREYAPGGGVSIMQAAVDAATGQAGANASRAMATPIAVAVGVPPTPGSVHVYDPRRVIEVGEPMQIESRKGVRVDAYDLALDDGVVLGEWTSGRAALPGPSEWYDQTTLPQGGQRGSQS